MSNKPNDSRPFRIDCGRGAKLGCLVTHSKIIAMCDECRPQYNELHARAAEEYRTSALRFNHDRIREMLVRNDLPGDVHAQLRTQMLVARDALTTPNADRQPMAASLFAVGAL